MYTRITIIEPGSQIFHAKFYLLAASGDDESLVDLWSREGSDSRFECERSRVQILEESKCKRLF